MTFKLNSKNIEIFEKLPRGTRSAVGNAILAKSFESGEAIEELALHLSSGELDTFLKNVNSHDFTVTKTKRHYEKKGHKRQLSFSLSEVESSECPYKAVFVGLD